MACGDRYKHLIRTHSGLTPDEPCGWVCSGFDYEDWKAAADGQIYAQVARHWAHLEAEARKADAPEVVDELRERIEAYRSTHDDLPANWWSIDWTRPFEMYKPAILRVIANMREGACLLEIMDDAIAELGGKAPPSPGGPEAKSNLWDYLVVATVLTVLGVGGYYVGRHVVRKRQFAAAPELEEAVA